MPVLVNYLKITAIIQAKSKMVVWKDFINVNTIIVISTFYLL